MKIRIQGFEPASRANGPGLRAVIWFQGCTLGCPHCFNPATHNPAGGQEADTAALAAEIAANPNGIEGVSFSGGEPLQQPEALLHLLQILSSTGLSTLVFSGYSLAEIQRQPLGREILPHLDVLIAGRYVASKHHGHGLLGSANQQIHLLTTRCTPQQIGATPRSEIILHRDGSMTISGISPLRIGPSL